MRNPLASTAAIVSLSLSGTTFAFAAEPRFEFEFAAALSGPCCGDSGQDIAVDADGSFFIVGNYGSIDFDGDGKMDHSAEGGHDVIVLKGRASGRLAWIRTPRSPSMSYARLSVAPDRRGGAFVAGGFRESLLLRSGERLVARGPSDGMLVRYSADGEPLWARAVGGEGDDWLVDASTDARGNVYLAGVVQGAVDLDSDGRPDANVGASRGLLVASWDPEGKLRWVRVSRSEREVMAGGGSGALAVTPEGEVHVAAHYLGADVDLDGDGRVDLPAPGKGGAPLLARFDSDGKLLKATGIGQSGDGRIDTLAIAGNGDLLVGGWSRGPVDLNGDRKPDVDPGAGKRTPYLARLDGRGGLRWARAIESADMLTITAIASSADRIAVSGFYRGAFDIDQDGRIDGVSDPDGKNDGFVAILHDSGAADRVFTINGPGGDQARGIDFSADGRKLWMTGFVRLTADFDGDGVPEGAVRCDARGDIVWAGYALRPAGASSGK